jgi:hypothetical protein
MKLSPDIDPLLTCQFVRDLDPGFTLNLTLKTKPIKEIENMFSCFLNEALENF